MRGGIEGRKCSGWKVGDGEGGGGRNLAGKRAAVEG